MQQRQAALLQCSLVMSEKEKKQGRQVLTDQFMELLKDGIRQVSDGRSLFCVLWNVYRSE